MVMQAYRHIVMGGWDRSDYNGKKVKISGSDVELLLESGLDWGHNAAVRVLEVNDEWIRIEYARTKEDHLV